MLQDEQPPRAAKRPGDEEPAERRPKAKAKSAASLKTPPRPKTKALSSPKSTGKGKAKAAMKRPSARREEPDEPVAAAAVESDLEHADDQPEESEPVVMKRPAALRRPAARGEEESGPPNPPDGDGPGDAAVTKRILAASRHPRYKLLP